MSKIANLGSKVYDAYRPKSSGDKAAMICSPPLYLVVKTTQVVCDAIYDKLEEKRIHRVEQTQAPF